MSRSDPRRSRFLSAVLLGGLLLLVGLGVLWLRRSTVTEPVRVLLIVEPAARWTGLTEHQRQGIVILLKDHLELDAGWVVQISEPGSERAVSGVHVLRLRAQRQEDQLRLDGQWTAVAKGTRSLDSGFQEPRRAVEAFSAGAGYAGSVYPSLLPERAGNFFVLAELTGWFLDRDLETALRAAETLVREEPSCANAFLSLGHLRSLHLVQRSLGDLEAQELTEAHLKESLRLCPGHPRAWYWLVRLLVDRARQREVLEGLEEALRERRNAPDLYTSLTYAARTVGLLDLALRSEQRRVALMGPMLRLSRRVENTYFYVGDWRAFESTMSPGGEEIVNALRDFYKGYARLCQGDLPRARAYLARAAEDRGQFLQFQDLARAYSLYVQGCVPEAVQAAGELRQRRARLQLMDGEYTFKIAELMAALGQSDDALDLALRAFGQGFACTQYFRTSPLLRSLQDDRRFQTLLEHLQERQQPLEQRFPARRFDL